MEEVGKTELTEDKQNAPHLFQPGQSGNPNGRPKGSRSFTTKVKEALEKIADGKEYTYEEAFIKAILKKAIVDQDTGMMRTVWEQLDGKPLQRSEITGKDGKSISITFGEEFKNYGTDSLAKNSSTES
jgi:hypothetical protein